MKKIIYSLALTIAASFSAGIVQAQDAPATKGAQIEFNKEVHDYGTIKNGADGSCVFEFKNTGDTPLIISNARGSCGCTVPEWPKEPIAPGEKGSIKVKYDTMRTGEINKSVTITSNAANAPDKVVYIKGNVLAPETVTPPVDNSGAPTNH
jgi:hypothetical protein